MNQSNTMKEIPCMERPYEKCERRGAESLSDVELLAVLLRTGTRGENALGLAERILYHAGENGILSIHQFSKERLMQIKGIGKVKALQLSCISELAKRLAKASAEETLKFSSPDSIARYYMEDLRHEKQEIMKLLMLNGKSKLIGETNISKGTVNAALITPRELFIEALQKNAVSIVIMHNHPSGDPTPSREDRLITRRIQESGALIGIELLDHIIIGNNCYISFREEGML
ncbi:RadC family protein [Faecalicatena contorta]|uniref:RadC family protein n=1 Tax=Faecalicatena contorta TaxID=39482 RepID=UPI001F1ACD78|nr:DNA repair protein RadC [Faecalicatena contorta]MCF2554898.1 DNA repair protein RadC [Faecalicatena contorta]MCF2680357.1 DNA repair protein RadC [Faecalicatena contorta]